MSVLLGIVDDNVHVSVLLDIVDDNVHVSVLLDQMFCITAHAYLHSFVVLFAGKLFRFVSNIATLYKLRYMVYYIAQVL
jgi:hypothetical protein